MSAWRSQQEPERLDQRSASLIEDRGIGLRRTDPRRRNDGSWREVIEPRLGGRSVERRREQLIGGLQCDDLFVRPLHNVLDHLRFEPHQRCMPSSAHRVVDGQEGGFRGGTGTQLADERVFELGRGLPCRRKADDVHAIAWHETHGLRSLDSETDAVVADENAILALHRHDAADVRQCGRILREAELQQSCTRSQGQRERIARERALDRGLLERRHHELDADELPAIVEDRAADTANAQMAAHQIRGQRGTRLPRDDDGILVGAGDERQLDVNVAVGESDALYESIRFDPGAVEVSREQLVEGDALRSRQCPAPDDANPRLDHHRCETAARTESVDLDQVAGLEFRRVRDIRVHVDPAGRILDEEIRPGQIVVRHDSAQADRISLFGGEWWQTVDGGDGRQELRRSR